VLKEREYHLDGLFLPAPLRCDQRRTGGRHQGPVAGAPGGLAVGEAFSGEVALLDFKSPADMVAWLAAG
jgi:hypothetical protein